MIRRTTWFFVVLFAVLLALAFFLQRTREPTEAETTPIAGIEYLFDTQDEKITSMRLEDAGGNVVAVERGAEDSWVLVEPPGEAADVARIESAIIHAESLRIVDNLESGPDLGVIGLDPPAYRVTVTLDGGRQQTALVGSATPTGSGYYARLEGGKLQIVNNFSVDGILEILTTPPIQSTPEPAVTEPTPPEE